MTKFQLFSAIAGNGKIALNGKEMLLQSIEREDASGSSFNLTCIDNGKKVTVYCRTID